MKDGWQQPETGRIIRVRMIRGLCSGKNVQRSLLLKGERGIKVNKLFKTSMVISRAWMFRQNAINCLLWMIASDNAYIIRYKSIVPFLLIFCIYLYKVTLQTLDKSFGTPQ